MFSLSNRGSRVLRAHIPQDPELQSAVAGAQASWTAPVLWRFAHSLPREGARTLAQSKTWRVRESTSQASLPRLPRARQ